MEKKNEFILTTIIAIVLYLFLFLLLWFDQDLIGTKRSLIIIIVPIWAFSIIPSIVYNINRLKQADRLSEFVAYILFLGIIAWILVSPYFMFKYYLSSFISPQKQKKNES